VKFKPLILFLLVIAMIVQPQLLPIASANNVKKEKCKKKKDSIYIVGTEFIILYMLISFLVADIASYRDLRQLLTGPDGIHAIAKKGSNLILAREIRADQYGIRTSIESGNSKIKFEIVLEGRISFDIPGPSDVIGDIATLSRLDLMASKLLANSDRWNDQAIFSRDMIDLVMLNPGKEELNNALQKAYAAYGESIHRDIHKAISTLLSNEGRLEACMKMLKVDLPKALLWQKLDDLRAAHLAILNKQIDKTIK
jgi:hypothetical protein